MVHADCLVVGDFEGPIVKIITLPNGAVVETDLDGNVLRTLQEAVQQIYTPVIVPPVADTEVPDGGSVVVVVSEPEEAVVPAEEEGEDAVTIDPLIGFVDFKSVVGSGYTGGGLGTISLEEHDEPVIVKSFTVATDLPSTAIFFSGSGGYIATGN